MHTALHLYLAALFLISCTVDAGQIRHVPQNYKTIQSAVDASSIGDTVVVDKGYYRENLVITKPITLAGTFIFTKDPSSITSTVIDGSGARNKQNGSTITVTGSADTTCCIIGFTITGGTGSYIHSPEDLPGFRHWIAGGGIWIENAGIRIAHNIVTGNHARPAGTTRHTFGGGIAAYCSPDKITNRTFVIIENNVVAGNSVQGYWTEGAGVTVGLPGIIRHNTIMDNRTISRTRSPGGGLSLYLNADYEIHATGNYLRRNISGIGGGLLVGAIGQSHGRTVITNNIIADNEAYEVGGGIHIAENARAVLINNTVVRNKALAISSGLSTASGSSVMILNNIFWNNHPLQISGWSNVRSLNNLIEGGFHGINTITDDPQFLPGDSIFRLSPESPAIGTGASMLLYESTAYPYPKTDFAESRRPAPSKSAPDLGAMESPHAGNDRTAEILELWSGDAHHRLRLVVAMHQITAPVYSADSLRVLRAGLITARVTVNDSSSFDIGDTANSPTMFLPPGRNNLEIIMSARGRADSVHLNGRMRLEGLDPIFNTLSRQHDYAYRLYSNISPGTYALQLHASDEIGLIDGINLKKIIIIVHPYWYQRWWSYGLFTLVVGALFAGAFKRHLTRLQREKLLQQEFTKLQLESQEAERNRLSSELHDGLGQNLLVIQNELEQLLEEPAVSKEDIGRVASLSQESLQSVREIASNLHPHHIEVLGFCAAVQSLVKTIAHSSGLNIQFTCDPLDPRPPRDVEVHLYRIIQEGLSNIVKHASAKNIRLEIRNEPNAISVVLSDDGSGFDIREFQKGRTHIITDDTSRGFGLRSMEERARIIGAALSIDSATTGTIIRLTLPKR
jgi:parallel beta-helix repeat protein